MELDGYSDIREALKLLKDDFFWPPITEDERPRFQLVVDEVRSSQTWSRKKNFHKGRALEKFACFVFKKFVEASVSVNRHAGDNETDIEVDLSEAILPAFLQEYVGQKMICECKNTNDTIDVGMVAKFAELLPTRGARLGVFISQKGLAGHGWKYAEGKRKKLFIKNGIAIVSLKFAELVNCLENNGNLYTMLKQKIRALYDEVDDNAPAVPHPESPTYASELLMIIEHFRSCALVDELEYKVILQRITDRYGRTEVF